MSKASPGVSYMEILIALAIFGVLLMAALPLLNQAGRNLAYAQDGYRAHLAAQSIMIAVRAGRTQSLSAYAEDFTVWSFSRSQPGEILFGTPAPLPQLTRTNFSQSAVIIVVVVRNEHGYPAGRAIGVTKKFGHVLNQ